MTEDRTFLTETAWLAEHLVDADLAVVDGSWHLPAAGRDARAEYLTGHVPGAVYLDIDRVADRSSGLPHMLPSEQEFAAAMEALGIGDNMRIVVYDADGFFSAPRVWWMLRVMGAGRVSVLNGGLRKWKAEGRPVEVGEVRRPAAHFSARLDQARVRDLAAMRSIVGGGTGQVVDARSASRFRGEEPEPRAGVRPGHMPGAINMHYASFVGPDGRFKDKAALSALFADAGVNIDEPVVTTCGSGVTAAVPVLALALLGRDETAIYDGSWAEWGAAPDTPVVTDAG